MVRSTGGEQEIGARELRPFEGLVHSTARMFAKQVRREEDDLAQELRIVIWRAVRKYDPARSDLTIERYVFGAVTNKIRDYKRDAAREMNRRDRYGLTFLHIEDMTMGGSDDSTLDRRVQQEAFDGLHNFVERDEVYREIDEGRFVVPSAVTQREAHVLLLLMMELTKPEVMLRLSLSRLQVEACITALREKFSDWAPTLRDDSSRVVALDELRAAVAA